MAEEVKVRQTTKYKYLCPACTNEAFYSNEIVSDPPVDVCPACGKTLVPLEKDRFVEL